MFLHRAALVVRATAPGNCQVAPRFGEHGARTSLFPSLRRAVLRRGRRRGIVALTVLAAHCAHGAEVRVEIEGLDRALAEAAQARIELTQYAGRQVSAAQVRRLFARAEAQIRTALEPFGYYQPRIRSSLEQPEESRYVASFRVDAGEPVRVRKAQVRVGGVAAELPAVRTAIESFRPRIGEQLDHGVYEASKQSIETALNDNGFLAAELLRHRVAVTRATNSADIDLAWEGGPRYRLGEVRFSESQFRPGFLQRYVPWKEGDGYSTDQLLILQQQLVDANYFSSVAVQPLLKEAQDTVVPVEVLLIPAPRTVYRAALFTSTDTGPGIRLGLDRRWVNDRGHKLSADIEYAQYLQRASTTYAIPRPGPNQRSYNFGAAYEDVETESTRSRLLRAAANDSRIWEGFFRTLGLQYLSGDFEIADEQRNSSILFAEAMLTRSRADNFSFPLHGHSLAFSLRGAPENPLSDTSFVRFSADARWVRQVNAEGRVILHGGLGTMVVDDFDALPPELRFFAGGDRTVRGFGYQEIGEINSTGGVIGGEHLVYGGVEYEHYFVRNWGAAVFVDAGDAFSDELRIQVGAGLGLRWRSPVGLVRVDVGHTVVSDFGSGWQLHLVIGPDL